ncbi:alpha/beta fold hydrolase [Chryseobacterium sp. PBS4-4]|uniref:Alpha/beta fold hydrolase n=1 Tax=Chryseobacterium edaphi TaxID=2976532 RepID=A0ABT2W1Y7_9FLAO|nr:alpha/beta fold hydrolase [Chryseobacterium edaphi]MCU7616241.1 alpha/beta fold hydrolase [Chryseobacterium edaphi]
MSEIKNTPSWLDKSLFPFKSRFLNIDGNTIHFVDEGQGPVLLLLHGNPTWSFLYRHIIKKLKSSFRCIALDYPGFGLSVANAEYKYTPEEHSFILEKFVEQLGLDNIRIMVQDWGGPIGLGFAGRRPELIHSLVIGNTWAWPATGAMSIVSKIFGSGLGRFFITRNNSMMKFILESGMNEKLEENEIAAYLSPFKTKKSRIPTWIFPKEIVGSRLFLKDVELGMNNLVDKPVLFIWGDADGAFREGELSRLQEFFPKNELVVLKGVKHYIQENAPDEICKAVLKSKILE